MLTRTSLSAVRTLLHLALRDASSPVSLREAASLLDESPTYLAKVTGHLVKAGILRARRGVAGGVVLQRDPRGITLLSVVEACQGAILGDFCEEVPDLGVTCAFHQAGAELHAAIVGILSRWTLADLLRKPCPGRHRSGRSPCWLVPLGLPARSGAASRLCAPKGPSLVRPGASRTEPLSTAPSRLVASRATPPGAVRARPRRGRPRNTRT